MKKIQIYISLLTILILMIVQSQMLFAATNPQDTSPGQNAALDLLTEIKGKKSFVGENMYLEIYKTTNSKPAETALKSTADRYGVSQDEIQKIVKEGDISSLLKNQKEVPLEQIHTQYRLIVQDYNTNLETENLRNNLTSKVSPSEIFADGNTSNSDFDLLYDLDLIEAILFNNTTASQYGKPYNSPIISLTTQAEKDELASIFKGPTVTDEGLEAGQIEGTTQTTGETEKGTNPISCFEQNTALQDAMNEYDEQAKSAQDRAETTAGGQTGGQTTPEEPVTSENLPEAPPDDWPENFLCPDKLPFCITIEYVMNTVMAGNYPLKANCVACHVQNINLALDKLNKKPMSPNKLTGNLFEMPKCKSSFTNIAPNMNVITMAIPPPGQANKDVFFQAKIEEQWKKFNENYRPVWYQKTTTAKAKDDQSPGQSITTTAVKKALMNAPPDATIEDVENRTNEVVTTITRERQSRITSSQKEETTENQTRKYQLIIAEINKMNTYFRTIKETIEKMKKPCDELSSKPKCS